MTILHTIYFSMKKITTTEFVKRAKKIHKNKYDYSNVCYINSWTKVSINCPLHGNFNQLPDNHIHRKSGCPKCKCESNHKRCNKGLEHFIADSKIIHKNKYNYSKSVYVNALIKLEIVCPKHGSFFQKPNNHLNGQGCPKCGNDTKTTEEFIREATKIHNNKYEYNNITYVDLVTKIPITCKIHGVFNQIPNSHLKGCGCPKCKKSKGELAIQNYLESNNIEYETPKTFSSCVNPKTGWNLYYDFYLPKKNLLIEFDGYQHYFPYHRDKFNEESLKTRKYRDELKDSWAKKNGTKLVRNKIYQPQTNTYHNEQIVQRLT